MEFVGVIFLEHLYYCVLLKILQQKKYFASNYHLPVLKAKQTSIFYRFGFTTL